MTNRALPSSNASGPSEPDDLATGRLRLIWAVSVILVVILAGGLFGYDQGVISGALLGIQKEFALGPLALEIVTSWVTLGALFGSLAGGWVADFSAGSGRWSRLRRCSWRAPLSRPSPRTSPFS